MEGKLDYAFDGMVIKLRQKDYDRWRKAYPNIDLDAELQARDDWLSVNPDRIPTWFISTSNYLKNLNAKARTKPAIPTRDHFASALQSIGSGRVRSPSFIGIPERKTT